MLKFFVYYDTAQLRVYVLHPNLTYNEYSLGRAGDYAKRKQTGCVPKDTLIRVHFAGSVDHKDIDKLIVAIENTEYPHKNQLIQLLLRDLI